MCRKRIIAYFERFVNEYSILKHDIFADVFYVNSIKFVTLFM